MIITHNRQREQASEREREIRLINDGVFLSCIVSLCESYVNVGVHVKAPVWPLGCWRKRNRGQCRGGPAYPEHMLTTDKDMGQSITETCVRGKKEREFIFADSKEVTLGCKLTLSPSQSDYCACALYPNLNQLFLLRQEGHLLQTALYSYLCDILQKRLKHIICNFSF